MNPQRNLNYYVRFPVKLEIIICVYDFLYPREVIQLMTVLLLEEYLNLIAYYRHYECLHARIVGFKHAMSGLVEWFNQTNTVVISCYIYMMVAQNCTLWIAIDYHCLIKTTTQHIGIGEKKVMFNGLSLMNS